MPYKQYQTNTRGVYVQKQGPGTGANSMIINPVQLSSNTQPGVSVGNFKLQQCLGFISSDVN